LRLAFEAQGVDGFIGAALSDPSFLIGFATRKHEEAIGILSFNAESVRLGWRWTASAGLGRSSPFAVFRETAERAAMRKV
jgi:hypothetical protein